MIADMQKSVERQTEEVLEKQDDAEKQMQTVAESTLQLGQVMMACENIYQRCMTKSHVARKEPKSSEKDDIQVIIEKLGFIKDYVTDLQAISRLAKPVSTPKADAAGSPSANPADAKAAAAAGSATPSKVHTSQAGGDNMRPSARESRHGHGVSARVSVSSRSASETF